MTIDFIDGKITPEQLILDEEYLGGTIEKAPPGTIGYISEESFWIGLDKKLWVDGLAPILEKITSKEECDYVARLIVTPDGMLIDISHLGYDFFNKDADKFYQFIPQNRPDYVAGQEDMLPMPIVGLITNEVELQLVTTILRDQYKMELPVVDISSLED